MVAYKYHYHCELLLSVHVHEVCSSCLGGVPVTGSLKTVSLTATSKTVAVINKPVFRELQL